MDFLFQIFERAYRNCPWEERSQAGFYGAKLNRLLKANGIDPGVDSQI